MTMRVDAYTHFIPNRFYKDVMSVGAYADIGKRMMGVPSIYDVNVRLKVVDKFKDYSQILSYPMPPFELMTKDPAKTEEYAKIVNDGFAELCKQHPDHFPGWVAQAPMFAPDVGVREAARAMKMGALGVQIYTNVAGKPLDAPEFEPFWKAMNKTNTPIWLHPSRTASFADYQTETKSKYEIWWTMGWSYETGAAMSRLVFSKIMDKYPKLKIITHHFGGIVPMLEGRIGPGWDQIGARTSDEDLQKLKRSLKKRPLDYFKHSFYCDTAAFGGKPATEAGLAFYDQDKIVFASDCPFDPEKGTYYIRETLKILDGLKLSKPKYKAIMHGNLEKLTGRKLA
jgi:predicted TIM-barrel fold metal-dependent hydrolase